MSTQFSSVWLIELALSGATTPGHSGPGSNGNERVLCIPQSSSITGTSPSDCFVAYPGHSLGESYPSVVMQSVYSVTPANWVNNFLFTQLNIKTVPFQTIYFSINIKIKVKLATIVEGNPMIPFSKATAPRCRGECYSIPWISPLPLTHTL